MDAIRNIYEQFIGQNSETDKESSQNDDEDMSNEEDFNEAINVNNQHLNNGPLNFYPCRQKQDGSGNIAQRQDHTDESEEPDDPEYDMEDDDAFQFDARFNQRRNTEFQKDREPHLDIQKSLPKEGSSSQKKKRKKSLDSKKKKSKPSDCLTEENHKRSRGVFQYNNSNEIDDFERAPFQNMKAAQKDGSKGSKKALDTFLKKAFPTDGNGRNGGPHKPFTYQDNDDMNVPANRKQIRDAYNNDRNDPMRMSIMRDPDFDLNEEDKEDEQFDLADHIEDSEFQDFDGYQTNKFDFANVMQNDDVEQSPKRKSQLSETEQLQELSKELYKNKSIVRRHWDVYSVMKYKDKDLFMKYLTYKYSVAIGKKIDLKNKVDIVTFNAVEQLRRLKIYYY